MANGGFTGRVIDADLAAPVLSVTVTLKTALPAVVGVPESTPVGLRPRPAGRPVAVQVKTFDPPVAVKV